MSPKDNDTLDEMLGQLQGTKTNTTKFITTLEERVGEERDVFPGAVHRYSTAGHEIREQQIDLKSVTKPAVPNSTSNLIKKMINDVSKTINFNPKHNERRECLAYNFVSGDGSGAAADVRREGILRTRVGSEGGDGSLYTRNRDADDEYTTTYTVCSNTLTDVSCTINKNNNSKRVKSSNNNINNNNNNSNNSDDNDANNIKTNPHDCFNETMRAALSLDISTTQLALVAESKQRSLKTLSTTVKNDNTTRNTKTNCKVTTTATTATTETTTTTTMKATTTLVNTKKSSTENKCTSKDLQQFSDQKTLEANTSKAVTEISANTQEQHQCEPLELTSKTLAERKALLKQEFFQEFHTAASSSSLRSSSGALSKRVLKRQHNLKLKIPSAEVVENIPLSLVAQRKLTLSQKFEKQIEVKCGVKQPQRAVKFPQIQELVKKFDIDKKMLVTQLKDREIQEMDTLKPFDGSSALEQRNSPLSDEGCNLGQSPYSSDNDDDDDNESIRTTNTAIERPVAMLKHKDKVARSASSDSALGLDVEEAMDASPPANEHQQKRRMTLTVTDLPLRPALLPLAEPTTLPDSPTPERELVAQIPLPTTPIPSKVLLEERVVEIPEDHRSGISSRRESSQSCLSDFPPNEMQGIRFVRTPSVVVSDYSDDIMCGITLEEIEYFRAQRQRRRRSSLDTATDNNSDVSAASSCSNLYYCGSTISALDGAECLVNGERIQLERKTSDCSITCSLSGDEDGFTIREQPEGNSDRDGKDITDMLAAQHLGAKRSKKVGISSMKGLFNTEDSL
ncbi:general transcriptional corepressor trfA-like isoform X1 [Glossina fuscipes]|uniref:General transcriptional corepressor trfA-like isoform X1 n=1 Tax=Glossina fuscipes TaxID=7396 RepID=A0A9C5Z478_9MUSC|nr:general transcriptional corepressor trfA-like isoform X1 [Glossina fuscipes]